MNRRRKWPYWVAITVLLIIPVTAVVLSVMQKTFVHDLNHYAPLGILVALVAVIILNIIRGQEPHT